MENLPKDIIEKITNELSPQDFISFDKAYCKKFSDDFWLRRIKLDEFDKILVNSESSNRTHPNDLNGNAKQRYVDLTLKITKRVEKMTSNILGLYEDFQHFLTTEYKEKVRKLCYDYTIECLDASIHEISVGKAETLSDFTTDFTYEYFEQFRQLFPLKMITYNLDDICVNIIDNEGFNVSLLSSLGFKISQLR